MRAAVGLMRDRWQAFVHRHELEAELAAELRWHLQQITQEKVRDGLTPEAAEREAKLQFGSVESLKENCRDIGGGGVLEVLVCDVRVGWRMLLKYPLLSTTTAAAFAVTVALSCTVFSIIDATFLRPALPGMDTRDVVRIWESSATDRAIDFSYPEFLQFRARNTSFSEMAAEFIKPVSVQTAAGLQHLPVRFVSSNLLAVIRTPVWRGREFAPDETPDPFPVCLITYQFAASNFPRPEDAIGRRLLIDQVSREVIGVLPAGFHFIGDTSILLPLVSVPERLTNSTDRFGIDCFARLKPSRSIASARAELAGLAPTIARITGSPISGVDINPMRAAFSHFIRPQLLALGIAGILLLASAYLTATTISLAKIAVRWREITLRLALGASLVRVMLQLLVEQLLIVLPAVAVGLLAAAGLLHFVKSIPYAGIHPGAELRLSGSAISGGTLLAIGVAVLATVPLIGTLHKATLARSARTGSSHLTQTRRRKDVWHGLVITQVAVSFLLLSTAFLLLADFTALRRTSVGFDPEHLIVLPLGDYEKLAHNPSEMSSALERACRAVGGTESAGLSLDYPMFYPNHVSFTIIKPDGTSKTRFGGLCAATPAYLETLGLRLLRGRNFLESDETGTAPVILVDDNFVRQHLGNRDPVGQRVSISYYGEDVSAEIVGVVNHIMLYGQIGNSDEEVQIYRPVAQLSREAVKGRAEQGAHLLVRTVPNQRESELVDLLANKLRGLVSLSPLLPPQRVRDFMLISLNRQATWLVLFDATAAAGLLLAFVGSYAVAAYAASSRQREMAIRLALGCSRGHVIWAICRPIAGYTLAGLLLVTPIGLLANHALAHALWLHDDKFTATLLAASTSLLTVLLASFFPASKAACSNISSRLASD